MTIRPCAAFTLIELLTVVAIIAILASILIPTANRARWSADRARTRVQFSQWAAAFEAFRQEYGTYPDLGVMLVNHGATGDAGSAHPFHDALAGVRRNGAPLVAGAGGQPANERGIRFLAFAESDFVRPADVAAGHNRPDELNLLRDGFGNTSIAVVMDSNLDGIINASDAPAGLPAVTRPDFGATLRPMLPAEGIHAGVIFYSTPPGATAVEELIVSWR